MTSIELAAPAKVNLFLKVLNKRSDSYHNILTLFEKISLIDRITISKADKGIYLSSDIPITADVRDNLAYKAAKLILEQKVLSGGVRIKIKKRIPIGSGLGGGSSDAASVLIGINKLFGVKLTDKELECLARQLGSDVPFFISDEPFAIGRGRGEKLKYIYYKDRLWHLIIYPGLRLPAKEIYEAFDSAPVKRKTPVPSFMRLTGKDRDARIKLHLSYSMDFDTLQAMLHNDLEDIVVLKKDVIKKILKRLTQVLARKVIVSGSGSSVFCLYRTRKEVARAKRLVLKRVPPRERTGWKIYIAKTYC